MLDASFIVPSKHKSKKWLLNSIEGLSLMEFNRLWIHGFLIHSWMDIWSSGFACIVIILCIASLSLASDMRVWRKDATGEWLWDV
jgi:hypothetical protein